jgi:hypothetical protein
MASFTETLQPLNDYIIRPAHTGDVPRIGDRKLAKMSLLTGLIFYDVLLWSFIAVLIETVHSFKTNSR